LFALYGFKPCLELAIAKTSASFALIDFVEHLPAAVFKVRIG
jgi:hypothetical protein